MRGSRTLFPLLSLLILVSTTTAPAQVAINPYVGVFILDDAGVEDLIEFDPAAIVGARVIAGLSGAWGVEGAYGYSPITADGTDGDEIDFDAHLLYGGINYLLGSEMGTNLLLAGGFGLVALSLDDEESDLDAGIDPILSLGAGFTHPIGDRVMLRGEVRDHIAFCSAPLEPGDDLDDLDEASPCFFDDETLNHIEVSGGIEIWL